MITSLSKENLIHLSSIGTKYKFVADSVWVDWNKDSKGNYEKKQISIICLSDLKNNVRIIHPITDFILSKWRYHTYNTQRKHALNATMFLNYLLENKRQFKLSSLNDLEIRHGESFLNNMTELEKSRGTVKDIERTLIQLFSYLLKQNVLPKIPPDKLATYKNINGKDINISPFEDVIYPSRKSSPIEHTFPMEYLPLFFEIAIQVARPIVLGIYLQIFGGLRVGEVINIKRTSLKSSLNRKVVLLKVIEQNFRTDIKDLSGSNYVKKTRQQHVFMLKDWFETLYKDHIELYKDVNGTGALFINRDGKAMTGRSYRQYFDKVKRHFIELLKSSPNTKDKILAHHLSMVKWSTHIGRGVFSNMLADYAKNPYEIAVPRGDTSLLSSLSYLKKTDRMRKKLEERLGMMHGVYIPRLIERNPDRS
ncbi:MAG TPA: hypothetical protein VNM69_22475 [Bacillus sp. (in: firmicutes)]|uniref:hypothetical protein n=1 Tax=Bacillus litorisediminis TaxID=2922713 RepID=UPI001FB00F3B|nr:hypothetical protein [Bacillus litorisediminis]HWO78637.1 hypothetical protein [Bacillus sp. (in: firmicutes)]